MIGIDCCFPAKPNTHLPILSISRTLFISRDTMVECRVAFERTRERKQMINTVTNKSLRQSFGAAVKDEIHMHSIRVIQYMEAGARTTHSPPSHRTGTARYDTHIQVDRKQLWHAADVLRTPHCGIAQVDNHCGKQID